MTPTITIFMVLTGLSGVLVIAGFRDADNWPITDTKPFIRYWLPVQIILGLWALAFYELFLCP